jgi:hypothetical protein
MTYGMSCVNVDMCDTCLKCAQLLHMCYGEYNLNFNEKRPQVVINVTSEL